MQQMPRLTATLTTENPSGLQPVAWTPRGDEVCLLVAATVVPAGVVRGMRGGVRCSARWSAGDSGAARSVLTAPGVCVHACARAGLSACVRAGAEAKIQDALGLEGRKAGSCCAPGCSSTRFSLVASAAVAGVHAQSPLATSARRLGRLGKRDAPAGVALKGSGSETRLARLSSPALARARAHFLSGNPVSASSFALRARRLKVIAGVCDFPQPLAQLKTSHQQAPSIEILQWSANTDTHASLDESEDQSSHSDDGCSSNEWSSSECPHERTICIFGFSALIPTRHYTSTLNTKRMTSPQQCLNVSGSR